MFFIIKARSYINVVPARTWAKQEHLPTVAATVSRRPRSLRPAFDKKYKMNNF